MANTKPSRIPLDAIRPDYNEKFTELQWHAAAATRLATTHIHLFLGESGCGKTEFVKACCRKFCGKEAIEMQGSPTVDDGSFLGRHGLKGNSTYFMDGPLPRALKAETWLIVNDVSHILASQLSTLLPLRADTSLHNSANQENIPIPSRFRLVMTMNPEQISCNKDNTALQSLLNATCMTFIPTLSELDLRKLLQSFDQNIRAERLTHLLEDHRKYTELYSNVDAGRPFGSGIRSMQMQHKLMTSGMDRVTAFISSYGAQLERDRLEAMLFSISRGED